MSKQEDKSDPPLILLIESDDFLLNIYKSKLEKESFKVLVAKDGEKGLEMIRKHEPNLILMEAAMPKLDGFEILKKIKKNKKLSQIPVVFLTNLSYKEDVKKAFDLGVDEYLIKAHSSPTEVISKIKKII